MSFRASKLTLPPVKTSGPVARYAPRMLVVPLANLSVPVPVTLEALVSVETPPANSSVAAPPIVNAPLLVPPAARLSAPLCTSTVPVLLNVTGTVDVQSGALSLAAGGTSSGAFTIGGAATLEFAGGVSTLATASSVAGTGTLRFARGTTNLLGTYLATGPLVFTGGSASFDTLNDIQVASLILQAGTGTFNRAL